MTPLLSAILGTAAVNDPEFLRAALTEYGERIAVGVDIKDGKVAASAVGARPKAAILAMFD